MVAPMMNTRMEAKVEPMYSGYLISVSLLLLMLMLLWSLISFALTFSTVGLRLFLATVNSSSSGGLTSLPPRPIVLNIVENCSEKLTDYFMALTFALFLSLFSSLT